MDHGPPYFTIIGAVFSTQNKILNRDRHYTNTIVEFYLGLTLSSSMMFFSLQITTILMVFTPLRSIICEWHFIHNKILVTELVPRAVA